MKPRPFFAFAGMMVLAASFAWAETNAAKKAPAAVKSADDAQKPAEKSNRKIPNSLMFTIDEINDIQSRMASSQETDDQKTGNTDAIENATLYLSTIVYYGPKDWTIWLNGKPISPGDEFPEFKVTEIGPRFVELLVPLSAQGMRPVRLEPNQTFIAKSGAVVEGPWNQ